MYVYLCVYVYIYVCVYVCMCVVCIYIYIYVRVCMCGFICMNIVYVYILFTYSFLLLFLLYSYSIYMFLVLIANNLLHCFLSTKIQCVFFIHKYSLIQDASSRFGYAIQVVSQHFAITMGFLSTSYFIHLYFCFEFFCYFIAILHQFIYVLEPYILFPMNNLFY